MKPTTYHLALWNRLHTPSWASKIEGKKRFLPETTGYNEIHSIINGRVGIGSYDFYRVANSINLYQLARRNGLRANISGKSQFSLEEYAKTLCGGHGSDEHAKNFNRWIRKINKAKKMA